MDGEHLTRPSLIIIQDRPNRRKEHSNPSDAASSLSVAVGPQLKFPTSRCLEDQKRTLFQYPTSSVLNRPSQQVQRETASQRENPAVVRIPKYQACLAKPRGTWAFFSRSARQENGWVEVKWRRERNPDTNFSGAAILASSVPCADSAADVMRLIDVSVDTRQARFTAGIRTGTGAEDIRCLCDGGGAQLRSACMTRCLLINLLALPSP